MEIIIYKIRTYKTTTTTCNK